MRGPLLHQARFDGAFRNGQDLLNELLIRLVEVCHELQVKSFVVQPRTTSADNTNNKGKAAPEIGAVHQMAQSGQLQECPEMID